MATVDKTKYIKVDGDLFREAFEKRGLVRNKVANEIGCGCAISNAISRGKIAKPIMRLLTSEYGITLEEVAPYSNVNTETAPKQPDEIIIAPQISEEQWARFKDVIKAAVLEAMNEYI